MDLCKKAGFFGGTAPLAVLFLLLGAFSLQAQFGPFVQLNNTNIPSREYITAAFGDFNNDGFIDLAATSGNRLYVFRNNPLNPGTFTQVLDHDMGREGRQVCWADFDNDGDLDLIADATFATNSYFFRNSGPGGNFALNYISANALPPPGNPQGAGWFDANQDGKLDYFISSGSGQSKIFRNLFDGQPDPLQWFDRTNADQQHWVSRVYNKTGFTTDYNARTVGVNGSYSTQADINNSGRQDILYAVDQAGSNNRLFVWLNMTPKGSATLDFYEVGQLILDPSHAPTTNDIYWTGVVAWDADNDGDLDILYAGSNHHSAVRDQFYENRIGYGTRAFSIDNYRDLFAENRSVPFGDTDPKRSGGVAYGDLNNDGWQDLYVVHQNNTDQAAGRNRDELYMHTGVAGLNYHTIPAVQHGGNANGVTFGDIDNDGDLDMFLCNGGKMFYNTTNNNFHDGRLWPAHPRDPNYKAPDGTNAEHYLDVMVSGASAKDLISTKDGIGSRVYLYRMIDGDPNSPAVFDSTRLVGLREIDGGSGYGSQATQVQHFGLDKNRLGDNPHLRKYAAKAVFTTGDTLWKFGIVPENVEVKIAYGINKTDTTYLAQTIEMSLLEVWLDPISRIDIEALPANATIAAGDTVRFKGTVWTRDRDGNEVKHPQYSSLIRWEWTPITAGTNPARAGIPPPAIDSTAKFWSTEAFTQYRIKAWLANPQDPTDIDSAFMIVNVISAAAHHISIEAMPTQPTTHAARVNDAPLVTVVFTSTESAKTVYAILRDRFGNWVGPVSSPTWSSVNVAIVTAAPGAVPANGEGRISRVATSGSTTVQASKSGVLPGTVTATLQATTYTKLRIVNANRDSLAALTMPTDRDTMLFAEGQNSATLAWEPVQATWSKSAALSIEPAYSVPASPVGNWRVYPYLSSTGTITITLGSVSSGIPATFTKGSPRRMFLYRQAGAPDISGNDSLRTNTLYNMTAGQNFTVFSKIFDDNFEWLDAYQNNATLAAGITWQVIDDKGVNRAAYLNRTTGSSVVFTPTRAHHVYRITASFNTGTGTILSATVQISVGAAAPTQLVIEDSYQRSSSPNAPAPWSPIEIDKNSKSQYAYAVLRDQFGNWHSASTVTTWSAVDTIVTMQGGVADWGQGIITRHANEGTTTIRAQDGPTGFSATAIVILRNITYDSLRIVVQVGSQRRDIDSLIMRTDRDTLLLALGMRSDDSTWEAVTVEWSSSGLSFTPAAPTAASWRLSPNQVGTGTVAINLGSVTDQIGVRAIPGRANRLRIYDFAGDPAGRSDYPDTQFTVTAGDTLDLFGKVFDHNSVWLGEFETVDSLRRRISWTDNGSLAGVFTLRDGHRARFVPTRAQALVTITSIYTAADTTFADQIVFRILPGTPAELVIEANVQGDVNSAQPLGTVTITGTDTTRYAHAILRDRFGNYIAPSNPTTWSSLNTTVVTAATRQAITGEGVIRRGLSRDGSTQVIAVDNTTGLRDSVNVVVLPYEILDLRIVVDASNDSGFAPIATLTMRTDQDTTLRVIGMRSDNRQWIPVDASWSATSAGGGAMAISPAAPGNAQAWTDFSPVTPDTGTITVLLGTRSTSINVYFAAGLPDRVVLYPAPGQPVPGQEYGPQISGAAGIQIPLVAKVFDRDGRWLATYESGQAQFQALFSWQTLTLTGEPDSTTGTLAGTGYAVGYTPTVAFRDIVVKVTFSPAGQSREFSDEIRVQTIAGPAHHIVLEANAVPSNLTSDDPVDTLTITADERAGHLFAIVRDQYGNYVGNSQSTSWASAGESIVTAAPGFQTKGEGVITRVGNGLTTVTATNLDLPGLSVKSAQAYVRVVNYYYTQLRIMIGSAVPDALTMSTNDDTTVHVQGLRSDTVNVWEDVSAFWELSEPLSVDPGPSRGVSWRFSPVTHGTGWIRTYLDNQQTQPDTLPVTFTIGAPTRVVVTVLTPPDSLVAGAPIRTEVRIYNRNGLVPEQTCFENAQGATYWDVLPDGNRRDPSIVTSQDSTLLNTNAQSAIRTDQCFVNGIDTVTMRLYYAPASPDSLHNVWVKLGSLEGSSGNFRLLPAPLDSLAIRSLDRFLPDDTTIVLRSPGGVVVLYSIGFDEYGNLRGEEIVDWGISGTLYNPGNTTPRSRMYYDASNATDNQQGFISARAPNGIADSVAVRVIGPDIALERAIMRDFNADGYIDAVQVVFGKPLELTDSLLSFITIAGQGYKWVIDSFAGADSSVDTAFTLYLRQIRTDRAQTDWDLTIDIDPAFEGVAAVNLPVQDGAGPVIWRVVKKLMNSDDRTFDQIMIIFSEPVVERSGADLQIGLSPQDLFEVFEYVPSTGSYVPVAGMLEGITELYRTSGDTAVIFTMSNGNDLLTRHFFRINADSRLITDKGSFNEPLVDNLKVRVIIVGVPPESVIPYPNPARPDYRYVPAGTFIADHDPKARRYVKSGGQGTVLTFKLPLPSSSSSTGKREKVSVHVKIYDIAGNLVHTAFNPDILPSLESGYGSSMEEASVVDVDLYWNGSNKQGMSAAPGIYRCTVYIDYENGAQSDARIAVTIGIAR